MYVYIVGEPWLCTLVLSSFAIKGKVYLGAKNETLQGIQDSPCIRDVLPTIFSGDVCLSPTLLGGVDMWYDYVIINQSEAL